MTEKFCPGPIGGSGSAGFPSTKEAVCIHTSKIYDSCKSKECLRDIRVYLCREGQELLNEGGIADVKPREAELLCVKIDVERVKFNKGFYSVDIRFFYRIEVELIYPVGRPCIVDGLAVFDKRVILFGSEGGARIFSSRFEDENMEMQMSQRSNMPTAIVEVVDPILLDARVVSPETSCNCCCCCLHDVPRPIGRCFRNNELAMEDENNKLFVTLGQFAIIRIERDIQLLIPAYDICIPSRDCSTSNEAAQDPCSVFDEFDFPIDTFFPPQLSSKDTKGRGGFIGKTSCSCCD